MDPEECFAYPWRNTLAHDCWAALAGQTCVTGGISGGCFAGASRRRGGEPDGLDVSRVELADWETMRQPGNLDVEVHTPVRQTQQHFTLAPNLDQ